MTQELDTVGQLGMQDSVLRDDESYLLALTWWEAKQAYDDAMSKNDIKKKEKARDNAKEAMVTKLELNADDVTRFRIMKEDDDRKPGEPFVMIINAKPPGETKAIAFDRVPKHTLTVNFEDKPSG